MKTLKPNFILFPVSEWERAKEDCMIFDHVFFTEKSKEVRKIEGRIQFVQIIIENSFISSGKHDNAKYKQVRWDGFGHCWSRKTNKRMRKYDIKLNN